MSRDCTCTEVPFRVGRLLPVLVPLTLNFVFEEYKPDRRLVGHILPTVYSIAFTNALKSYKTNLRQLRKSDTQPVEVGVTFG